MHPSFQQACQVVVPRALSNHAAQHIPLQLRVLHRQNLFLLQLDHFEQDPDQDQLPVKNEQFE